MTTLDFLNTRRKDLRTDTWLSTWIWYSFLFSMVLIAGINFAFFITRWQELTIIIDDTAIYITFVGFLFAFAGINIYSIFNTNIEEEKKRLYDLSKKYQNEMHRTMLILDYSKKHIKYYQLSQMLAGSKKYNSQVDNWLGEFNEMADNFREFLYNLAQVDKDEYEEMSADFTDINRSVFYLFCSFLSSITEQNNQFFNEVGVSEKENFLKMMEDTVKKVDNYQIKDFSEPEHNEEKVLEEPSLWAAAELAWKAIIWKFKNKDSKMN